MTATVPAPSAPPAASTGGWRTGDWFTARIAGLPLSTVDGLRCPRATDWAEAVLALRGRLAADGVRAGDLLHDLIGGNEDEDARRRLLALRRQIHNNVLPADPEPALAEAERIRPSSGPELRRWLAARTRLARLEDEGAAVFAAEIARSRRRLWELADEPRLRGGLQLASPTLDQQLAVGVRPDPDRPANKRVRRVERSLLSYLYRTACKTSPFSTFTGVALGRFDDDTESLGVAVGQRWQRYVRLNVVLVSRIADLISADPVRRGDLPVALSPGWRRDAERIRYVRHWVTAGDDRAAVSFDSVRDGLFFLRRSGVLDELTALLRERGTIRGAELVDRLCERTGADRGDGQAYLSTLLRLGMLRLPGLDVDVHRPDPVRALAGALSDLDRPWAVRTAHDLTAIAELVDAYRDGDLVRRRAVADELRAAVRAAMTALGEPEPALPQTLLYEDSRIDGDPVPVSAPAWRRLTCGDPAGGSDLAGGGGLAAVERVLPAFDQNLPHRIMFHGFFLARFGVGGRCDDLLRLVEDFHDDLYDQYSSYVAGRPAFAEDGSYTPEENWLGRPEMTALDTARQTFADRLRRLAEADAGQDELRLPEAIFDEVGDLLGGITGGFRPQGHFVQVALREPEPLLVLNQSFGGLSFPFSRFTHCFSGDTPSLAERLREQARAVAPPDAVFAELTGGAATTNLNLHDRLTDHVIVCPGETSDVAPRRQLTLDDLHLVHDPDTDRVVLRSTRLDREVIPVYLGYLVPMALPQIPRTLLLLSPASMVRLDPWRGVPAGPAVDGVTTRPRLRVGDVVLSRRSWSARAGDLPDTDDPGADADAFLRWRRWRAEHDVPTRVFATVYPAAAGRAGANPKPQYVDFDSPLSLQALRASLGAPDDRIVLREMLPAADELAARGEHGGHVCELAVETFRTEPGGTR
ncbi:lantibiotic dehydratase [Micromonospora sp. WMMD975]|uniref:lantibiotic dehydratase n=1 Tax=Micromonospora sp. WMMD975 TaxID=3016087 RepID=UPI00249CA071|nr:lantibiotic dehydratase [Micromonospora sp. WMMD975]WFE35036.1 lantibiotic dehydratase [Micromonospora sp. WMMD975]